MKILILSFYFPPDLSAGSFRTSALIDALKRNGDDTLEVDVITTQPNRYSQLADTVEATEDHGWLRIKRITLPSHNSGMRDQSLAFVAFMKGVFDLTKGQDWDMVYATSSRLMTAALGAHLARRLKIPLYLDIRDLFLDTMNDVLHGSSARHLLPFFKWLEKMTFQKATRISVVSEGFLDHLRGITSSGKFSVFTNGIDEVFLTSDFRKVTTTRGVPALPRILYAGNIGEGQGLHHILPQAAVALENVARFRVVGGGGRAPLLHAMLDEADLPASVVETHAPVPRGELLEEYRQADILFLHLNDYDAFRKVLPSKIFEYAATGKPIIAGVAGHAADFLKQHVPHAEVFDPCDVDGMICAVRQAVKAPSHVDRSDFRRAYARSTIMDHMAKEMLTFVSSSKSGT